MTDTFPINDTVGAWVPHGRFVVRGAAGGPLGGLTFAAKDLYDVAGRVTGAGNPSWLATHAPASRTSPVTIAACTPLPTTSPMTRNNSPSGPAITSCSTGRPRAGGAGSAPTVNRGSASPPARPPRPVAFELSTAGATLTGAWNGDGAPAVLAALTALPAR